MTSDQHRPLTSHSTNTHTHTHTHSDSHILLMHKTQLYWPPLPLSNLSLNTFIEPSYSRWTICLHTWHVPYQLPLLCTVDWINHPYNHASFAIHPGQSLYYYLLVVDDYWEFCCPSVLTVTKTTIPACHGYSILVHLSLGDFCCWHIIDWAYNSFRYVLSITPAHAQSLSSLGKKNSALSLYFYLHAYSAIHLLHPLTSWLVHKSSCFVMIKI